MQLIPPIINPNTKSDAERLIFDNFQNSNIKGVAIHALDLSKHQSKLYSEIDFVIITERGVLCLEVKGGDVRFEHGKWAYTNRHGITNYKDESPFTQARSNKEYIMKYVRENHKKQNGNEIKYCIYGYGVIFTDITFHERGAGIDLEIVFDNSHDNIDEYINNLYNIWENRICELLSHSQHSSKMPRLKPGHIALLQEILIGKTGCNKESIEGKNFVDIDGKLNELSEKQYKVFQYGIQNRRQLIEGGAGTGKTLIGIKYAIEKAKEGNRVLFLCFNILLRKWIDEIISCQSKDSIDIKVINFHDYLLELTGLSIPNEREALDIFYKSTLPSAFIEIVDIFEPYDTLIVDEGQDLLLENYLICIDQFVIGGLDHGNWIIMYDENQNLYLKEKFQIG